MEYGAFSEAAVNWFFLKLTFGLIALGAISVLIAYCSHEAHQKNYSRKNAIMGHGIAEGSNITPYVAGLVAASSFIGAIVFLIFGLLAGHTGDCMNQKYASEGTYRVISTTLVYNVDSSDDRPTSPKKFDLKLEGRGDSSSPSDWKVLRCVTVPYDRMVENYKVTPRDLPTFEENKKAKAYVVHKGDYGDTAHADIDAPEFITKKGGNWWKFSDETR